jgi:hypothetical protein
VPSWPEIGFARNWINQNDGSICLLGVAGISAENSGKCGTTEFDGLIVCRRLVAPATALIRRKGYHRERQLINKAKLSGLPCVCRQVNRSKNRRLANSAPCAPRSPTRSDHRVRLRVANVADDLRPEPLTQLNHSLPPFRASASGIFTHTPCRQPPAAERRFRPVRVTTRLGPGGP